MTRYKDQCLEVQQKFDEYLQDMTNDQAIAKINDEYGSSHAFACATQVQEFVANDNVTQLDSIERVKFERVKYPHKKKVRSS